MIWPVSTTRSPHRVLDDLPQTRHLLYLRQVLVHIGALDERDEDIEGTLPWVDELLERQSPSVSTIVRPYATWSVLRRARRRSKVTENRAARKYARSRITLAVTFLNGLEDGGRTLQEATQTDIDRWLAVGGISRHRFRDFILWARSRALRRARGAVGGTHRPGELPRPSGEMGPSPPLRPRRQRRIDAARGRCPCPALRPHADADCPADRHRRRAAWRAHLAQARPQSDGPARQSATIIAELAGQAAAYRHSIVGSKPARSPWLFPGGAPGHHARASWISEQLNCDLGLSLRRARNTALCTLAEDLPASVLADLLGIHITTATRWTKLVKRDWAQYVSERTTHVDIGAGSLTRAD